MKKIFLLLSCAGALTFASCAEQKPGETDDRGVTNRDDDEIMKDEYTDGAEARTATDVEVKEPNAAGAAVEEDADGEMDAKSE